MFTEIGIENFKAFGKMQRIPLKPITLLYGPNSSGKSSLIQALLLLKQTLEESGDISIVLLPKGNLVDLGVYKEFIHGHDVRKEFCLSISLKYSWDTMTAYDNIRPVSDPSIEFAFFEDKTGEVLLSSIKASDSLHSDQIMEYKNIWRINHLKHAVLDRKAKLKLHGDTPIALNKWLDSLKKSTLVMEYMDMTHWLVEYNWNKYTSPSKGHEGEIKPLESFPKDIKKLEKDIKKEEDQGNREYKKIADDLGHLDPWEKEKKLDKLKIRRARLKQMKRILKRMKAIYKSLMPEGSINDVRKIRNFPASSRLISLSNCFPKKVELSGDEEWYFRCIPKFVELGKPKTETNEIYESLNPANNYLPSVSSLLQKYLRRIMYIGPLRESPERVYSYSGNIPSSVGKSGKYTPDILKKKPDLVTKINEWFDKFDINYKLRPPEVLKGNIFLLSLDDNKTKCEVNTKDVGFGIGQLLPILVQGILSDNKIIFIEQPEIHIHPRLQAELGSFFAEMAGTGSAPVDPYHPNEEKYGNQFIIETHSEHLVLRLQKLIRKGKLKKEDVAVIYCDKTPDGTVATELRLNDKGEFIDPWPHGFFEESFNETFGD